MQILVLELMLEAIISFNHYKAPIGPISAIEPMQPFIHGGYLLYLLDFSLPKPTQLI